MLVVILIGFVPSYPVMYQAEASEPLPPVIQVEVKEVVEVKSVKEMVEEEFGVGHIMVTVAKCESGIRQFKENGEPLKSHYGTDDIGVYQINQVHLETLEKLGLDRNKTEDNIKFARYLYDKNGLRDWSASKECWGK